MVAIAIPVFTSQLEKSRESTDLANLRSAYAEEMTRLLTWDGSSSIASIDAAAQQTRDGWQNNGDSSTTYIGNESYGSVTVSYAKKGSTWHVAVNASYDGITISH